MNAYFVKNPFREFTYLKGDDSIQFLQGLISNDARLLAENNPLYAAFLTPQGKFLEDLFITPFKEGFLIDSFQETVEDFRKKLLLYKLRSRISIEEILESYSLYCLFGNQLDSIFKFENNEIQEFKNGIIYRDPRHMQMGLRAIMPSTFQKEDFIHIGLKPALFYEYDRHRMNLGIPDGARDIPIGKGILLEYNFDEMDAIDWEKGCYLGQELTARTKYRGIVRKRLLPFRFEGEMLKPESIIYYQTHDAGEVRSSLSDIGLGLFRLEYIKEALLEGNEMKINGTKIYPFVPSWLKLDFSFE